MKASPQMKHAWELLEAGDVLSAVRHAEGVLKASTNSQDADEAKELLARQRMPRQALAYAALAAAVMVILIALALFRTGR